MKCQHKQGHVNISLDEMEKLIKGALTALDDNLKPIYERFKKQNVCAGDFTSLVANVIFRLTDSYIYYAGAGVKDSDSYITELLNLIGLISKYHGIDFHFHNELELDESPIQKGKLH